MQQLANHPEVQRRLQEELDHVVGRGRLVTEEDMAQLPVGREVGGNCGCQD